MHRRYALGLLASAALAAPAAAAPARYLLDREKSTVGFSYILNGKRINGRMPIKSADILLDVDAPGQSRVVAVIDASAADAGPFYATIAMKAPEVLDTGHFPEIVFRSEKVEETRGGAQVTGLLTLRGVTRKVTLEATLFRQRGTEAGDRRFLSILMTGSVDRRDFGAGGYAQFVQPTIELKILTRITLAAS